MMDQIFAMMSTDADMGPALRDADVPQRFDFDDVDLVVNIRATRDGRGRGTYWDVVGRRRLGAAGADGDELAGREQYFQGKENIAMAIARRRIKTGGDVKAALALIPITKPVFARYRDLVRARIPAPGGVGAGSLTIRGGRRARRRDARDAAPLGARRTDPGRGRHELAAARGGARADRRPPARARPLARADPRARRPRAGSPSATSRTCCPGPRGS